MLTSQRIKSGRCFSAIWSPSCPVRASQVEKPKLVSIEVTTDLTSSLSSITSILFMVLLHITMRANAFSLKIRGETRIFCHLLPGLSGKFSPTRQTLPSDAPSESLHGRAVDIEFLQRTERFEAHRRLRVLRRRFGQRFHDQLVA